MNGKVWYKSRTLWFNVFAFSMAVGMPLLTDAGYTGDVPAGWAVFLPAAAAVANAVLRYVTKEPIVR